MTESMYNNGVVVAHVMITASPTPKGIETPLMVFANMFVVVAPRFFAIFVTPATLSMYIHTGTWYGFV